MEEEKKEIIEEVKVEDIHGEEVRGSDINADIEDAGAVKEEEKKDEEVGA